MIIKNIISVILILVILLVMVYYSNSSKFFVKPNLLIKLEKKENIEKIFSENYEYIIIVINIIKIKPRIYLSVIYGELKLNYDSFDRFDILRAKMGFDPSLGFAQMKVSTAKWIEDKYANNVTIFKSKTHEELMNKLINDSTNILYSAFYIKLINDKLYEKFGKKLSVKLIASYYGYGIDRYENEMDSSYSNQIGITAQEFYDSDKLLDSFPR